MTGPGVLAVKQRRERSWALDDCRTQRRYMREDRAGIWPRISGLSPRGALREAQLRLVQIRKARIGGAK